CTATLNLRSHYDSGDQSPVEEPANQRLDQQLPTRPRGRRRTAARCEFRLGQLACALGGGCLAQHQKALGARTSAAASSLVPECLARIYSRTGPSSSPRHWSTGLACTSR